VRQPVRRQVLGDGLDVAEGVDGGADAGQVAEPDGVIADGDEGLVGGSALGLKGVRLGSGFEEVAVGQ
jgi:hypothetical protein